MSSCATAQAAILARRSDRFEPGAAISGINNFGSAWGAGQSWETLVDPDGYTFDLATKGYVENGQMRLGGPPWARTEAYLRASPLYRAPDIKTRLMLMVGDFDLGTTNLQQTERLRRPATHGQSDRYGPILGASSRSGGSWGLTGRVGPPVSLIRPLPAMALVVESFAHLRGGTNRRPRE